MSTAARIPDFRSAEGLFTAPSKRKGRTRAETKRLLALPAAGKKKEPSVRDLFHVKSLSVSLSCIV